MRTSENTALRSSPDPVESAPAQAIASEFQEFPAAPSLSRQPLLAILWLGKASLGLAFLIGLLALAATIPFVNVVAMGYLMEAQAQVARTGKLRSACYLFPMARRLGACLLAVWVWLLPLQFLAGAARDSWLLAPGATTAWLWTSLLVAASVLIAVHLLLAIACGGHFSRFLRPLKNARQVLTQLKAGEFWRHANHEICRFIAAIPLLHLLRLGLLGYAAAYVWLVIPTLLFTSLDDITSRWQFLAFLIGGITLTLTLLWLPFLLAHVSAKAHWRAMFELRTVWNLADQTPFRWAMATAILFASSVVLPLYSALLKIQIPPHDARWDVMVVFLVTVVPARVVVGWAYHHAAQQDRPPRSWLWRIWSWTNGAALCVAVGFYVYFLNLAATSGELGRRSLWQFHAVLLPFPF